MTVVSIWHYVLGQTNYLFIFHQRSELFFLIQVICSEAICQCHFTGNERETQYPLDKSYPEKILTLVNLIVLSVCVHILNCLSHCILCMNCYSL